MMLIRYPPQVFGRTTLTVGGYWTRQDYVKGVDLDNVRYGGRLDLSRNLTRRTSLTINADYSNRDFSRQGDDQNELRTNLGLSHQINRSLELNWSVRFEKRTATTTRSYQEWTSGLQLRYIFWGAPS
jgi:hypothetical protein